MMILANNNMNCYKRQLYYYKYVSYVESVDVIEISITNSLLSTMDQKVTL